MTGSSVHAMAASIRSTTTPIDIRRLGAVDYQAAWQLQRELADARVAGGPDTLLLLEHPSVYTAGRRTLPDERPVDNTPVVDTDRGGKITYHGPGQLVGYPIMRIEGVHEYVAALERAIIAALAGQGVQAEVRDGLTGVWAPKGKIASIGVRVKNRVSMHGLAVNVDNDLQPFEWVVPCGMEGTLMSSVCKETGESGHLDSFREALLARLCEQLGREARVVVST